MLAAFDWDEAGGKSDTLRTSYRQVHKRGEISSREGLRIERFTTELKVLEIFCRKPRLTLLVSSTSLEVGVDTKDMCSYSIVLA